MWVYLVTSHVNKHNLELPLVTSHVNKPNLPLPPLPSGGKHCHPDSKAPGLNLTLTCYYLQTQLSPPFFRSLGDAMSTNMAEG